MKLKEPDFRMRDVELVLRFFAYRNFIQNYSGDLKKFLDDTTKYFNENWDAENEKLSLQASDLDKSLIATRVIFGERAELRKWNGSMYEKRINRAVFDIMTYYFSEKTIRDAAVDKGAEIKIAFQKLCEENR
ncbi:hypothetical protein ABUE31_22705, partial [Mesorhizobium sp. ZMM04-5]